MMMQMTAQNVSLPQGTVTLLFSDVDGSTRLLARLGDAYAEALDAMRSALRAAWDAHGGVEMGTEGDSFFVVFETARAALSAATEAQRALTAETEKDPDAMRVRMGIHTGTPMVHAGGYVGMDVHRAARIAAAAHGGQVVVSAAVAELTGRALDDGTALRDLGPHQLKDIGLPERLYQVVADGLVAEFPPLRTLGRASSLPSSDARLVGREGEIVELSALLRATDVRLVTLTGPGGAGKTRLSIGLAEGLAATGSSFPDGVYFVPLAEVTEASGAWEKLAEAMALPTAARTRSALLAELAPRETLLILDNLEQMDDADDLVASLMEHAPRLTVVATSRHPLHIAAEHEHPVPALQLPTDTGIVAAERSGAVQLFLQYAQRVRPSLQLTDANADEIADICRRLDGLPLALQLTAARVKVLSPKALLSRLDDVLDIATAGGHIPSRQHTLRETIDWSYALLQPYQQAAFRQLGVFAGGADLDAIEAVVDRQDASGKDVLDLLSELVDANLVIAGETTDGEPRFSLLETIRAYARGALVAAGELAAVRLRHAEYFATLAEAIRADWDTDSYAVVGLRFGLEVDNLREALGFTTDPLPAPEAAGHCASLAMRLAAATGPIWSSTEESCLWGLRAIELAAASNGEEKVLAITQVAVAQRLLLQYDAALAAAERAAVMARQIGSVRGEVKALHVVAMVNMHEQRYDESRQNLTRALELAESGGYQDQLAKVYDEFGLLESFSGNEDAALGFHQRALDTSAAMGIAQSRGAIDFRHNVADSLRLLGRIDESYELLVVLIDELLATYSIDPPIAFMEDFAAVLAQKGMAEEAARLFGSADAARTQAHLPLDHVQAGEIAGAMAIARTDLSPAGWDAAFEAGQVTPVGDALRRIQHLGG